MYKSTRRFKFGTKSPSEQMVGGGETVSVKDAVLGSSVKGGDIILPLPFFFSHVFL